MACNKCLRLNRSCVAAQYRGPLGTSCVRVIGFEGPRSVSLVEHIHHEADGLQLHRSTTPVALLGDGWERVQCVGINNGSWSGTLPDLQCRAETCQRGGMTSNRPITEPALRTPRHSASTLSGWRNAFRRHCHASGVVAGTHCCPCSTVRPMRMYIMNIVCSN